MLLFGVLVCSEYWRFLVESDGVLFEEMGNLGVLVDDTNEIAALRSQ